MVMMMMVVGCRHERKAISVVCLRQLDSQRHRRGRRTTMPRMSMGTRETDQPPLWIAASDLPASPGHPFYARLNAVLGRARLRPVRRKTSVARSTPTVMGRPSLPPGQYFRLLLVGYFEGIDSERGIAWRAADSLAVRSFVRLALHEAAPDHSTISRTRRLIDVETHRAVFTWVQQRLVEVGLAQGQDRRDRRDHAGSQRRDAQHRAAGHGGDLSGVSDAARAGLGHRDADARGLGAAGSEAEEEDVEQGLDESRTIPMRRSRR